MPLTVYEPRKCYHPFFHAQAREIGHHWHDLLQAAFEAKHVVDADDNGDSDVWFEAEEDLKAKEVQAEKPLEAVENLTTDLLEETIAISTSSDAGGFCSSPPLLGRKGERAIFQGFKADFLTMISGENIPFCSLVSITRAYRDALAT